MEEKVSRRRFWYWGLVLCLFAITVAIGLSVRPGRHHDAVPNEEPSYQGKTLSVWLLEASPMPDDNDAALNAIRAMGPPAVPFLVKAFRDGRLPGPADKRHRESARWEVQNLAAEALQALGPAAAAGVPSLLDCMKSRDKGIRGKTAAILGQTGVAAKPVRDALLCALDDGDVAFEASRALAVLGRKETNVVYELMRVAEAGKRPAAYWSAVSLAQLGARSRPALPVLIELSNNPTPDSDWESVKAIGMIGPDATAAVPVLMRVLQDGGPWARKCAAISLGRIGPGAAAAIPALRALQGKEDSNYTKADIARALWRIDRGQLAVALPLAISIIEEDLSEAATGNRISYGLMSALDLLGEFGTGALPALDLITEALEFDDPNVQLSAAWALWQVDPGRRSVATNVLCRLLDVENFPLEDFGRGVLSGLAPLKRSRESYHVRIAAGAMLWQIAPEMRAVLNPILKQLLKEWRLYTSMKSIIPEDAALVPVLRDFLRDDRLRDIHPIAEAVLEQVTGVEAERW